MDGIGQKLPDGPEQAKLSGGAGQTALPAAASPGLSAEKIFWGLAVFAVVGFFVFFAFAGLVAPVSAAAQQAVPQPFLPKAAQPSGSASVGQLAPVTGGIQEITLTVQGANYMPNPIRVKKGVPVRITADLSSVRGCASSIVIPDFGVRKAFRQGDNVVEFTPDKSGTFDFGCSMWMYTGKIVVEEADGKVAANTGNAAPRPTPSCGGSGGGCGCSG